MTRRAATLLLALWAWPVLAHAEDDALGFGDAAPAAESSSPASPARRARAEPSPWSFAATLRVESALRLEESEPSRLAKLRQVLGLRLEYQRAFASVSLAAVASGRSEADFAYLGDLDAYAAPTLEVYAWQVLPGEVYLALRGTGFELAFGEQIVNLGQAEVLSVLDVLNPRDLREPLQADLDSQRLPVLMTRAGWSSAAFRVEIYIVHEAYFGLLPPPLGEWSPFRKLLLEQPGFGSVLADRELRNQHIPERFPLDVRTTQPYARFGWTGTGIDLALLAAAPLDALGVPVLPPPAAWSDPSIALPLVHSRYGLLGHSGAWSVGPFLLRWEAALELGRPLALRRTDTELLLWSSVRRDAVSGLFGLTWASGSALSAALELAGAYVFDNPARSSELHVEPLLPVELPRAALRFHWRFLRDRAELALLGLWIVTNAWAARAQLAYAPLDRLELGLGYVTFHPTDEFGPFYGFERADRLVAELRLSL